MLASLTDPSVFLPLMGALTALVFALIVIDQFRVRGKPYQLVWGLALLTFAVAIGARFWGAAFGWNEVAFKLWYGGGAYAAAALLGMGTAYLMLPRRAADLTFYVLLGALLAAFISLAQAPLDLDAALAGGEPSGAGLPGFNRALSAPFNVFGTIFFVGGALWSGLKFLAWPRGPIGAPPSPYQYFPLGVVAFLLWLVRIPLVLIVGDAVRTPRTRNRAIANGIIASGGMIFAASGTLAKYFGQEDILYLAEFAGTLVIFAGFLVSIEVFDQFRIPFTSRVLYQRQERLPSVVVGLATGHRYTAAEIIQIVQMHDRARAAAGLGPSPAGAGESREGQGRRDDPGVTQPAG